MIRCLNRRDVGINQHREDAFFFDSLDGLATGIIEFAGLANFERAAAQNQNSL